MGIDCQFEEIKIETKGTTQFRFEALSLTLMTRKYVFLFSSENVNWSVQCSENVTLLVLTHFHTMAIGSADSVCGEIFEEWSPEE